MTKTLAAMTSCALLIGATAAPTAAIAAGPSIDDIEWQCERASAGNADTYCYFETMGECHQFIAYMRANDGYYEPVSPRCIDAIVFGVPIGYPIRGEFDIRS